MSGKAFLDTNILVYLHSSDEPQKQQACMEVISRHQCCTSVQALNEFCYVGIKKQRRSREEIELALERIESFCQIVQLPSQRSRTRCVCTKYTAITFLIALCSLPPWKPNVPKS
ncbi:MAG: PIN domain-containing protein [Oscillospiraceae bacterium]|jgi:predicted nucleic acid-binding protein|nr:PIN domain-containing protein [Oscillospiraceae bacterium]